jgi:hypothetical protein
MAVIALALMQTSEAQHRSPIAVDYPAAGSIFPPEFPAPTFLWRDAEPKATSWRIEIASADGAVHKKVNAAGEPMQVGELDPDCKGAVPPTLSPEQAAAHTWTPDAETWTAIKRHSITRPAVLTFTGYSGGSGEAVSSGEVTISTSKDPVGAPIFYRDVPIIPSPTEKGVIKPLPSFAIGLIKLETAQRG